MRSTPAIDEQLRLRLSEAVERFAGSSVDKFARLIGYTNGGYVREVLGQKKGKFVREALIDRVHNVRAVTPDAPAELANWFEPVLSALKAHAPPPPKPPRDFQDHHVASASDWGLLEDIKFVMEALPARAKQIEEIRQEVAAIRAVADRHYRDRLDAAQQNGGRAGGMSVFGGIDEQKAENSEPADKRSGERK